jgi:hypothetical protein
MRFLPKLALVVFATLAISGGSTAVANAAPILMTQSDQFVYDDYQFGVRTLRDLSASDALGLLPTRADAPWTDTGWSALTPSVGGVIFHGFDADGAYLGLFSQGGEDRFLRTILSGRISEIGLTANTGNWDIGQSGGGSPAPVPEPSTLLMVAAGAAAVLRKRFAGKRQTRTV